jgi:hypothetical protein
MATYWFVIVPTSEANVSSKPANAKIVSAASGTAAYNAYSQTGVPYNGYVRFQGPFTSEAAAQAASPTGDSTAQVIAAGVGAGVSETVMPGDSTAAGEAAAVAATNINNPLDFLKNIAGGIGEIGDAIHALTEENTWIRIAKVVAGGLLLLIGLAHITGAENKVASIARKVPIPV